MGFALDVDCNGRRRSGARRFPLVAAGHERGPHGRGGVKNTRGAASSFVAAACYALLGYGYIIPATFLPALARQYIDDPVVFGWVWPVFGAAAALSTLAAARFGRRLAAMPGSRPLVTTDLPVLSRLTNW